MDSTILTQHPQVEGFIFLTGGKVTVAYFPRSIFTVQGDGTTSSVLAAALGDHDDHTVVTVDTSILTADF